MKFISKYLKVIPVLFLVLGMTSCSDDDEGTTTPQTVVDAAIENGYTSLAAALQATNLVTTLQAANNITVFAPTNSAFDALLTATGIDLANMTQAEEDLVTKILLNHVVIDGAINSTTIINNGSGYVITNAQVTGNNNLSLYYRVNNGVVELNGGDGTDAGADVSNVDIVAGNGIVHEINKVLGLPTVVDMAIANPDFGSLVASLLEADGSAANPMYVSTLSGTGPFTVFAPNNEAFQALLDSNMMWNSPADIDDDLLNAVLAHHVIAGQNVQSGDLNQNGDTMPETLQTDMITITLPGTNPNIADVTDGAGNDLGIIAVDVQADNGVIHVINAVMIPST